MVRSNKKNFAKNEVLIELVKKRKELEDTVLFLDYFSLNKNKTTEQVDSETSATLFFLYKEHLLLEELELENYEEYFSEKHFSFVSDSHQLSEKVVEVFFDGNQSKELYLNIRKELDILYLMAEICFINYKIFYYIYDEENFFHIDNFEKNMKAKILESVEELNLSTNRNLESVNYEELLDYLFLVIYSLKLKFKVASYKPIKVFIRNTKNFVQEILKEKVQIFWGDRIECVETLSSQVDIVVTDVRLAQDENQTYQVYVSTFSDTADISFLIAQIQNRLLENYEQRQMQLPKVYV